MPRSLYWRVLIPVCIYAVLGLLWIHVTDRVIQQITTTQDQLFVLEEVKGDLFILITATILAFVLLRLARLRRTQSDWIHTQTVALEYTANPVVITDPKDRIVWGNTAFYRLSGYTQQEIQGKNITDLRFPLDPVQEACRQQALQKHGVHYYRTVNRRKDGTPFTVDVTATAVQDATGVIRHIICIGQDVTQQEMAKRALQASEAKYHALVETTSDWVWEIDEHLVCTDTSGRVIDILGYEPHEVRGKRPFDFMPPDEAERAARTFEPLLTAHLPIAHHENVNLHKNGQRVILETSAQPIFDETGTFRGYRGIHRDITARKQAEEALQDSERRYRELADLLPQTVFELNQKGYFTYANQHGFTTFGYTANDLERGIHALDVIAPQHHAQASLALQRIFAGNPFPPEVSHEYLAQRRDGSTFPAVIYTTPIQRDQAIIGVRGIVVDIGDQKRAQEAMQQHVAQLETVREVATEIAATLDLNAVLQRVMEQACHLTGADGGDLHLWDAQQQLLIPMARYGYSAAHPMLPRRPGEGANGHVALTRHGLLINDYPNSPFAHPVIRTQGIITAALLEPLLSGEEFLGVIAVDYYDSRKTFGPEHQSLLRLFAAQAAIALQNARLFRDQQEAYANLQRAQEELVRAEKLRALGQLAAGINHELNNVLGAIHAQAELLFKDHSDLPGVQDLIKSSETGAHIVRRLNEFSCKETEQALEPLALPTLIAEVVEMSRPKWRDQCQREGRRIEIKNDVPDLPPVLGSATEIKQALLNLVLNAIDAMPDGGTVRFTAHRQPPVDGNGSSGTVDLLVTDTGTGMPEEVQRRIFDPFFTTKGTQGTGMGLAIVYGIMKRHGGDINVVSTSGIGTTFRLRFQATTPITVTETAALALPQPTVPLRILVVDDDASIRRPIGQFLNGMGHQVLEAENSTVALHRFAEESPDMVLTDFTLMGDTMNGIDLARRIRRANPRIPVLLCTGWNEDPACQAELQGGLLTAILEKPILFRSLLETIERHRPTQGVVT